MGGGEKKEERGRKKQKKKKEKSHAVLDAVLKRRPMLLQQQRNPIYLTVMFSSSSVTELELETSHTLNFATPALQKWRRSSEREGEKKKKLPGREKKSYHTNLPSTRSWLTCHSIAAILWSCPMLSLPLRCQQPSSDAAQWKIRHLIKKTSAVACRATCRPILITLHHGKSSFISKNSNLTDIKTRIRFFSSFFFLSLCLKGLVKLVSVLCVSCVHQFSISQVGG